MNCACGKALGKRNTSGRCAKCTLAFHNSDPATIAKRRATNKRLNKLPERIEKRRAVRMAVIPRIRESLRAAGRASARYLLDPDARARGVITRRERQLGWCPPDRMADYERWRRYVGAAEARRMIEEEIEGTVAYVRRRHANAQDAARLDLRPLACAGIECEA